MDIYKKLLEYEEMLKDGVISEAEFQKLKKILYSGKMSEFNGGGYSISLPGESQ